MADLSKLSTPDLMALKNGKLSDVSNEGLMVLKEISAAAPAPKEEPELTWPQVGVQGALNLPKSALGVVGGIAEAALSPVETVSTLGQIAKGGVQNTLPESLVGADPEAQRKASAMADFYRQRYGSMKGFKQALATDPAGVAADVSTLFTGGGAALSKAPMMARAGEAVSAAGRTIDPVVLALRAGQRGGREMGKAAAGLLGTTTGVGREAVEQAFRAGKESGQAKESFIANLRGTAPLTDVLEDAKANLNAMRQSMQSRYRSGMVDIKNDNSVLDFSDIDQALANATNRVTYKGRVVEEGAAKRVKQAQDAINEWRALDPVEYHTPEGMDALKKRIGDILEDIPYEQRNARGAVEGIYNSIRGTINRQAPTYSDVMRDYSKSSDTIREMERALSLNDKASADTAMRKLQSLMRNNVQTNYGQRLDLARQLEAEGGREILPALAGQAMSEWSPRGLQRASAPAAAGGAYVMGEPATAAGMLALSSPRLVGEATMKAGQIARGLRQAAPAAQRINTAAQQLNIDPRVLANFLYQAGVTQERTQ